MHVIFFIMIPVIIAMIVLGAINAAKRRKEMIAWAASKGLSFRKARDSSMENRYPEFDALQRGSNRYAYDIMQGMWGERSITAFDYHYETHSTDSDGHPKTDHHNFSAVIISGYESMKPLFIRPESFFDKISEFIGFDDIDFESAEFSRKFYVKAQDKKWAYDVIHQRMMAFLLDAPRFHIQFGPTHVIASRGSTFKVHDFEAAADVICGILDRFPDYLVREMKDTGQMTNRRFRQ